MRSKKPPFVPPDDAADAATPSEDPAGLPQNSIVITVDDEDPSRSDTPRQTLVNLDGLADDAIAHALEQASGLIELPYNDVDVDVSDFEPDLYDPVAALVQEQQDVASVDRASGIAPDGALGDTLALSSSVELAVTASGGGSPRVTGARNFGTSAAGSGRVDGLQEIQAARPYSAEDVIEIIGPYEVLAELGRGGMGVVYKAYEPGLKRFVALKVILPNQSTSDMAVARFINEARLAARLQHPNIVRVYDAGETDDGISFFAMAFVKGRDLGSYLEEGLHRDDGLPSTTIQFNPGAPLRDGRLTLHKALEIIEASSRAIHSAHQQGIVHRDIKPDNILIDGDLRPLLTDFRIAKAVADEQANMNLTTVGDIMGTPHYMSPEQANGELSAIGARSDVYSLGAMLFHVITGRTMFVAPSSMGVLYMVIGEEPQKPSLVAKEMGMPPLPVDLETICLKATEKEAHRRYESAEAFANDLRAFLDGDPINARPLSQFERVQRALQRNRATFISVTVSVLLIVTLAAAFGISLIGNIERTSQSLRDLDTEQALAQAATLERAIVVNMLQGRADLARDLVQNLVEDDAVNDIQVMRTDRTPAYTDLKTRRKVENRLSQPAILKKVLETYPELREEIEELKRIAFSNIDRNPADSLDLVDVRTGYLSQIMGSRTMEPRVYQEDYKGKPHLVVLKPIENAGECQACHGEVSEDGYDSNHIRAVLVIRRPLDRLTETIESNRRQTWLVAAVTIVAILGILLLIGRVFGIGLGGTQTFGVRRRLRRD